MQKYRSCIEFKNGVASYATFRNITEAKANGCRLATKNRGKFNAITIRPFKVDRRRPAFWRWIGGSEQWQAVLHPHIEAPAQLPY